MRLIKKVPLVFQRHEPEYYDENGELVKGLPVEVDTRGSLQPYRRGKTDAILAEGISSRSAFVYYTKTMLRGSDQFDKTLADTTVIKDRPYKVFDVMDWSYHNNMLANHFRVILVMEDQATGGNNDCL